MTTNEHPSSRRDRSTVGLLADLFDQSRYLVSTELELARAELSEKMNQGVAGLGLMIGGAVLLIGAVNVLFAAAVSALIEAGVPAPWSSLIVAIAAALAAWMLVSRALNNLKAANLAPRRTASQLKRDAALVKETVQ